MLRLEDGKPVTKSRAKYDQGQEGMGRGWSRPTGGWFEVLFWAQVEQANTNCLMPGPMEGTKTSEFLGDRSAWMSFPTEGLQGAVPPAQIVDQQDTPSALHTDDQPPPLAVRCPEKGPHHHSSREDSIGQCFPSGGPKHPREGVKFDILRKCETKPAKKECPAGLTRI